MRVGRRCVNFNRSGEVQRPGQQDDGFHQFFDDQEKTLQIPPFQGSTRAQQWTNSSTGKAVARSRGSRSSAGGEVLLRG